MNISHITIPSIEIIDLLNVNNLNKLLREFASNDHRGLENVIWDNKYPQNIIYEYMETQCLPKDEWDGYATEKLVYEKVELDFYKDFLIPAIKKMPFHEIGKIEIQRKTRGVYGKLPKIDFYQEKQNEYHSYIDKITSITYLQSNMKDLLIQDVIGAIIDYIQETLHELEFNKKEKVPFANMGTENLVFLVSRLYEKNYISGINPPALGDLMINNFQINGKPIPFAIRNKINNYLKKEKWKSKHIDELNSILDDLRPNKK